MGYLFTAPLLVVLGGSALAAAAARSFRSGVWAAAWVVLLATAKTLIRDQVDKLRG